MAWAWLRRKLAQVWRSRWGAGSIPLRRRISHTVQEGGEECPVGRGEARLVDLALQDGELVTQRQNLDVLVRIAHRQQPDEGERAGEGEVRQSQ
jgi:hypothetical protein